MSLPAGWRAGLTPAQVAAVLSFEAAIDRGEWPELHEDARGYFWIYLPKGHPLANGRGRMQRLHRYVVARALGRRLPFWAHVHHPPGVPRDCRDADRLEVMEACDHGVWHHGQRLRCGHHLPLDEWAPRDERGRFTPLPMEAAG